MDVDLRELFATPWEGEGTLRLAGWLRLRRAPRQFAFRTEARDWDGDRWTVHDTTTWPNGRVDTRVMASVLQPDGSVRVSADDMPDGGVIRPREDGFDFEPYRYRVGRVTMRFSDAVRIQPDGSLLDTIEMRLAGVRIGTIEMRLRRISA